jgi:ABC-type multidrug transport system fused ATPase/permease subunit
MDPALIVLDEATSSLDTVSEVLIQAAMANLLRGRTAIIVAHRLSTIVDADLIVVMEGGLVVQKGTHAELLAEPHGLYRLLCVRQFGEPGLAGIGRSGPELTIPAPHLGGVPALRRRTSA